MSKARSLADLGNAYDDGALSNRNLIINGAMQVAQRGTSFTLSGAQYTLDRWNCSEQNGAGSVTQETFALGGSDSIDARPKHFLRLTQSTAATNYMPNIQQPIELCREICNQTVTLSFWIKADKNVDVKLYVYQPRSSGHQIVNSLGIGTANTSWQKITYTFDIPSASGITFSGTERTLVYLQFPLNDTYVVDVTNVQLEVGDTATPFEHRSYGDELARCQRYLQRFGNGEANVLLGMAHTYASGASYGVLKYHKTMRATPTGIVSDTSAGAWRFRYGSGSNADNTAGNIGVDQYGKDQCRFYINTGTAANNNGWVRGQSSSSYILLDAEL